MLGIGLAGCSHYGLPDPGTAQGQALHNDWVVFFYAGLVVALLVYALIIGSLFAWRRRSDALPAQFSRNYPLEIVYTILPLLLVVALFIVTYRNERSVEALTVRPAVTVDITGFRWSWRFTYAGVKPPVAIVGTPQDSPQLVLPVGETTRINLTSADVIHAFWVPGFLFKRDAIAGMNNKFDLEPTRTGTYRGVCAEFCGLDHALMGFSIKVVSAQAFTGWLTEQQRRGALAVQDHRT